MARTASQIRVHMLELVGPAFSGIDPFAGGFGAAQALAESAADDLLAATLLSDATGGWLDLYGRGEGIRRIIGEDDDTYRARIGALPVAVVPAALKAAVDGVLSGAGFGACAVYDLQNAAYFAADNDTAATEGVVELFADGNNILISTRQVWIVCPDVAADEAVELAVCSAAASVRGAGFTVFVIFADNYTPATGNPWDAA